MNDADRNQVEAWIEKHGFDRCPQCSVEENLSISQQSVGAAVFVALTCKNCGLVRLLNPSIIGLAIG